ncbi:MAG: NADH-quinone oxidoreductase subunit NuoH [Candidatus Gastranaerophilales bacterium]|nr:NADH-quinone oxidoreductase subunit NuoH [Candidatus Gastranaerophilales bacterium]
MDYLYFLYLELLHKWNLPDYIAMVTFPIIPFCFVAAALIVVVIFLVLAERKILAFFTQRKGPNRVGPWGLFQTIADAIKLLCKENITPEGTDKFLFTLAPLLAFIPVLVVWGIIPFCNEFDIISFSINSLLFVVIAAIPILGILLAGYASNNKYSLIGSVRSVAQAISYELPLIFVLLSIVVLASSMNLKQIVLAQSSIYPFCGYFVFPAFLGFVVFFACGIAELNRCPFDLPEAESELVSGYNTEYSGMKFAFFFLAEYAMMFIMCAFIATLFLGGFLSPLGFYVGEKLIPNEFLANLSVYFEQAFWVFVKTFFLIFCMIWVRATLPRLKSHQLTAFAWKVLLPLSLLNLLIVCLIKAVL